jgi:hypothetical protein
MSWQQALATPITGVVYGLISVPTMGVLRRDCSVPKNIFLTSDEYTGYIKYFLLYKSVLGVVIVHHAVRRGRNC